VVLVGGQTRMPLIQNGVKEFFGKEAHKGVNPDEVVAVGAALQAGVLAGDVKDMLLLDVTPLSLGIETRGEVMTKIIPNNTTIPTKRSEIFTTAADNQTSVEVHVLQGEREMAGDNRTLGRFHLVGILPAPRGIPQVEVEFDIDANGIVHVTAKDKATGKSQDITITASSGLTDDEIQRMVKDAEAHADEDKKHRRIVDARNQCESLVCNTEKTLKEHGEKVSDSERKAIEDALAGCRKAMEGEDADAIEKAMQELMAASHKLAEQMYAQARAQEGQAQAQGEGSSGDGASSGGEKGEKKGGEGPVIDAEYEDVDKEKGKDA
jgi:molecular chaperone DnaK